ncbi:hypothetical protein C8T65DRAFT_590021, partial [Cerioporus squamosus]
TGRLDIGMSWSVDDFIGLIVHREGRLVKGWPAHILFGDPGSIPGGVKSLKALLDGWKSGEIRFVKATAEDLRRARRDRRSVLPSTPVPQRPTVAEKRRASSQFIPGRLVMEPVHLEVIARPKAIHDDGAPPTKRLRMTTGQRSDNSTVRAHRKSSHPRSSKTGVKTPRNVLDDDASPTGMVVLDDDLARSFEEGEVEM